MQQTETDFKNNYEIEFKGIENINFQKPLGPKISMIGRSPLRKSLPPGKVLKERYKIISKIGQGLSG